MYTAAATARETGFRPYGRVKTYQPPVHGLFSTSKDYPSRRFQVEVYESKSDLSDRAAHLIVDVAETKRGTVLTPGCNTPLEMYRNLVGISYSREVDLISLLKGDEGAFYMGMIDGTEWPIDNPLSFPYYFIQHFLRFMGIPALCNKPTVAEKRYIIDFAYSLLKHVYIPWIPVEATELEKMAYVTKFSRWLAERKPIDLIIGGLGPDGHVAFLGPGQSLMMLLAGRVQLWPAIRQWKWEAQSGESCVCSKDGGDCTNLPPSPEYALTISHAIFIGATRKVIMATGEGKAAAVREMVEGQYQPERFPAHYLRDAIGEVLILLDEDAASDLSFIEKNYS